MRTPFSTRKRCSSASAAACWPSAVKNFPVQTEFAAENHVLLHEHALLSAAVRSSANFVAAIPDRGIRPQPRLLRTPRRRPHSGLRLCQRRIIRQSDLLQLFQS